MTAPDQRTLLRQAVRGTGFVLALGGAVALAALAIAAIFVVVME